MINSPTDEMRRAAVYDWCLVCFIITDDSFSRTGHVFTDTNKIVPSSKRKQKIFKSRRKEYADVIFRTKVYQSSFNYFKYSCKKLPST